MQRSTCYARSARLNFACSLRSSAKIRRKTQSFEWHNRKQVCLTWISSDFFAEINRHCSGQCTSQSPTAALKKQPLTLVLTAPDEYRLQFLARYAIIIVSSSTVTYICITEECASDKCAEIAAFFSRKCSTCSRTTKMSRTCGTTGKSKHPFLWIRNKDGEIVCLSILFAFSEASVRFTT